MATSIIGNYDTTIDCTASAHSDFYNAQVVITPPPHIAYYSFSVLIFSYFISCHPTSYFFSSSNQTPLCRFSSILSTFFWFVVTIVKYLVYILEMPLLSVLFLIRSSFIWQKLMEFIQSTWSHWINVDHPILTGDILQWQGSRLAYIVQGRLAKGTWGGIDRGGRAWLGCHPNF